MTDTIKPLHSKQSEILIDQLLYPNSTHRNLGCIIKLYGEFDKDKFLESLENLASLHDVFRHEIELVDNVYYNTFRNHSTYFYSEVDFSEEENEIGDVIE